MSLLLACAVCAGLVAVDVLARGVRLQWLLRGAGCRLPLAALCESILFGDAAAATTPMRLGGEPARWLGLMGGGVPPRVAAGVLALEMATYLSIVALSGALAAWTMGGAWWAGVGPGLAERADGVLPWALVVLVASVAVWTWVRRRGPARGRTAPVERVRGAFGWPVAAAVPLTLVSIAARLGMLPVLAQTLPSPPPLGVLVLGSFALVYGQLFFPTPGGAGAVELLAAARTAGELGGSGGAVFLAWRAVTTGLPVVIGYGLALRRYGGGGRAGRSSRPAPRGGAAPRIRRGRLIVHISSWGRPIAQALRPGRIWGTLRPLRLCVRKPLKFSRRGCHGIVTIECLRGVDAVRSIKRFVSMASPNGTQDVTAGS